MIVRVSSEDSETVVVRKPEKRIKLTFYGKDLNEEEFIESKQKFL